MFSTWHSDIAWWKNGLVPSNPTNDHPNIHVLLMHLMTHHDTLRKLHGGKWPNLSTMHCPALRNWINLVCWPKGYAEDILTPFTSIYCNVIQCHPFHLLPNKRAIIDPRTDLSGRRSVSMASKTTLDDAQMRGHLLKMLSV